MSVFSLKIDIADNKFFNGETSPLFSQSQAKLARQFHQKIAGYHPTPGGIPGGPWRGAPIQILCVSGRPDGLGSGIPDPGAAGLNGGLLRRRGRGPAPPYNLEGRNENG